MDPRFTVTTVQDTGAYRSTVLADYILHQKAPTPVFYAVALLLGGFLWWGGLSSRQGPVSLPLAAVSALLTLALCALAVPYVDRFAVKRVSARILKTTLKNVRDLDSTLTYAFGASSFTLTTPTGQVEHPYGDVTHLCQTQNHLLLFLGKQFCFTLSKAAAPQGLAPFLEDQCGVTFRTYDF